MGLLDDIGDAVAQRGRDIMAMIKSGKADEVTREMLDMGDPVMNTRLNEYFWNNYDLPMDTASRMARRDAGGFNAGQPLYRGDQNPDALAFGTGQFAREGIGVTASDSPNVAATYMTGNTPAMYPLYARAERPLVVDAGGRNWAGISAEADTNMGRLDAVLAPDSYLDEANLFDLLHGNKVDWGDGTATGMAMANTDNVARAAQAEGFDQVQFRDIVDRGGAGKYSTEAANTPHTTVMTSDPRNVRSRFARFDPRLRHIDNLNAGVAGATAVGAGLLGYGDEANAMPAPQAASGVPSEGDYSLGYRDTLGQLYQMDGGVMYPKGQSVDGLLATVGQPMADTPQPALSAFDEALRYYLGPTGIPERIVAANEILNPVRGIERGMQASGQAFDPNSGLTGGARALKAVDATTETLGALLGLGGSKAALKGAEPLIEDALAAGARFGAEETGSVNLGGLYNALGRVPDEALANATPFRRTGAENFAEPRRVAGRAKDPALYTEFSTLKQDRIAPYDWEVTGRKLAGMEEPSLFMRPEDIAERFDAIYGYPADATLNNTIIDSVNGVELPTPILQQAGHTFIDNPRLGFASERNAMASRNNAWQEGMRENLRVGVTPMVMGPKGGDFSQHLGQTQAQLMMGAADRIDPNYMPNLEALREAGLTGLLDPRMPYVLEQLKGGARGSFIKELDKNPAMAAGVPSVAATRWATMDPNLVGADMLSSGYRFFEPLRTDAIRRHGGELHATYTGAVNKVGPSMTMGEPRPWYLMFPDEALPLMEASTRKGSNMPNPKAMPKDLRKFQMNTKLRQMTDREWVDVNSKYDEIKAAKGKEAADMYAIDALLARANRRSK